MIKFIFRFDSNKKPCSISIETDQHIKIDVLPPHQEIPIYFLTIFKLVEFRTQSLMNINDNQFDGFVFKDYLFELLYPYDAIPSNHQRINKHLSRFSKLVNTLLTAHGYRDEQKFHRDRRVDGDVQVRFEARDFMVYHGEELFFQSTPRKVEEIEVHSGSNPLQKVFMLTYAWWQSANKHKLTASVLSSCALVSLTYTGLNALEKTRAEFTGHYVSTHEQFAAQYEVDQANDSEKVIISDIEVKPHASTSNKVKEVQKATVAQVTTSGVALDRDAERLARVNRQIEYLLSEYETTHNYVYLEELSIILSDLPQRFHQVPEVASSRIILALEQQRYDDALTMVAQLKKHSETTPEWLVLKEAKVHTAMENWVKVRDLYTHRSVASLSEDSLHFYKKALYELSLPDEFNEVNEQHLVRASGHSQAMQQQITEHKSLLNPFWSDVQLAMKTLGSESMATVGLSTYKNAVNILASVQTDELPASGEYINFDYLKETLPILLTKAYVELGHHQDVNALLLKKVQEAQYRIPDMEELTTPEQVLDNTDTQR